MKKYWIAFIVIMLAMHDNVSADFIFSKGRILKVSLSNEEEQVVHTAFGMFSHDYHVVFGGYAILSASSKLLIGTLGKGSEAEKLLDQQALQDLRLHPEAYVIKVQNDHICIVGSDKRGTAYGILELSRRMGVSPWEWWADAKISKMDSLVFKNGFKLFEYPSVKLRGIFINDEDWGLTPWSYLTHEPSKIKGQIGPKTHARIFELLLRLRANTFWPAMHEVSVAFYLTPGNKEIADKYGIVVGASHCEPMMRNANAEWKLEGTGNYDYVHNRPAILKFWEERVKQLKNSDNLYTLGIRGVHDGKMQGANTLQEQYDALTNVLKDQREMIRKNLNRDVEKIPQVFIPYKEVLDVYNMGLKVPDDVTLMWCDDNYGYIRRLPDSAERARKGGNGVYYHVSYWGRPHDYLWLSTNHPAQIYTQMKMAYNKGAKDIWILNVGDIKPGEYLTELFLDMAWNINALTDNKEGLDKHMLNWLTREFGQKNAADLAEVMHEYYRLAYIRKPEFMGNTRTEEQDPKYKTVSDLPWDEQEIKSRIAAYDKISEKVISLSKEIGATKQDAWYQLIEYPVRGATEMNKKMLYAQLARHGKASWEQSDKAFDTIETLTSKYNNLGGGKWKNMMDDQPRKQPVFMKVPHTTSTAPMPVSQKALVTLNGNQFSKFEGKAPVGHGLGYEGGAISLGKNSSVFYAVKKIRTDSVSIEVALAPNHPVEGKLIRFAISLNGKDVQIVDYHTVDRNEEWKRNVLTNRASRTVRLKVAKASSTGAEDEIQIKALDEGVILDQIKILAF
ncbi:glycosyl hydrolase 115 family protein [Pedobacter frigidisoli]|uniref:glycosyl hydrolase 115 family protein n=1 Tax=Pedobacter frigidisoli TaxID=2530455 RepID=UPI002931A677|nr:glycosyl hydrolase 115 family protein [Pedobacter frigidisoli]